MGSGNVPKVFGGYTIGRACCSSPGPYSDSTLGIARCLQSKMLLGQSDLGSWVTVCCRKKQKPKDIEQGYVKINRHLYTNNLGYGLRLRVGEVAVLGYLKYLTYYIIFIPTTDCPSFEGSLIVHNSVCSHFKF